MISTGQQALASDFISTSAGAGSSGQVPKCNSLGKIDNSFLPIKFGGTGADGVLSITSGTTTISAGSASVLVKNYTSISITGTGKLVFSNPGSNGTLIFLKSQGNVTLTSSTAPMIDASNMGGPAGTAGYYGDGTSPTQGAGGNFYSGGSWGQGGGGGGGGGALSGGGTGYYSGSVPAAGGGTTGLKSILASYAYAKGTKLVTGAGGGTGNNGAGYGASGGAGGVGGGCLVIECAGYLNFTTANGISAAGSNGGNGTSSGNGNGFDGGGGGGGGGGTVILLYNLLTANSGTVNVSGGNGGNGGTGGTGSPAGSGGGGGSGLSLVAQNTEFT